MFLKNKHFLVALLVAPILAIFAWYATDMIVAETPLKPEIGKSYQLVEHPSCRWKSGKCILKNNNFEIKITIEKNNYNDEAEIKLKSNFPLEGAQISLFLKLNEQEMEPVRMNAENSSMNNWTAKIKWIETGNNRIRLVVKQNGVLFFGDADTAFIL